MSDPLDDYAEMTKMWIAFHEARPDVELSWFLQHYKDGELLAPVEPPVLSREFLDSLIETTFPNPRDRKPPATVFGSEFTEWLSYMAAAEILRDAILESLSQEDGQ